MKILAIGAHFDDVELGCGGTLLKHKERGDDISIIVITHSGYESPTTNSVRSKDQAKLEGEKCAKMLGASLICCDKEPTVLVPTEKFVLEVEHIVSKIKPDRVYTHRPNDSHADHAAVGYVSLRACRKCDEILLYRSNWFVTDGTQEDNFYVDISPFMEQKINLIRVYESEMKKVNYSWIDFVKKQNYATGAKVGVKFAETFHFVKMFWR